MSSQTYGVRLFAAVREAVGSDSVAIELGAGATAGDLLEALTERHPGIARHRDGLQVAVNQELARPSRVLGPGDEVALIPPVGGG